MVPTANTSSRIAGGQQGLSVLPGSVRDATDVELASLNHNRRTKSAPVFGHFDFALQIPRHRPWTNR